MNNDFDFDFDLADITLSADDLIPGRALIKPVKPIAEIVLCGGLHFTITDMNTDFIMPTEEQRKNLKEMLCIEVIPVEDCNE